MTQGMLNLEPDLTEASCLKGERWVNFLWHRLVICACLSAPVGIFHIRSKLQNFIFYKKWYFEITFAPLVQFWFCFSMFFVSPRDTFMPNFKVEQQLWDKLEVYSHCGWTRAQLAIILASNGNDGKKKTNCRNKVFYNAMKEWDKETQLGKFGHPLGQKKSKNYSRGICRKNKRQARKEKKTSPPRGPEFRVFL